MNRIRADIAGRSARTVVLAHAFVVVGGDRSERSISVGGVETVPLSAFDGIDYVALGHLHSRRSCPSRSAIAVRRCRIRSARLAPQAVWIVDLDANGLESCGARSALVRGLSRLTGLSTNCSRHRYSAAEDHYVSATLTDHARPVDAMRALANAFRTCARGMVTPGGESGIALP